MHILSGETVSETVMLALRRVHELGSVQESRNGSAKAIFNVMMEVTNPQGRHLDLVGRKSNIFQQIAETFWVMAGANAVSPYLEFFLPRAPNYSDDGMTWHGAYGPRIYEFDQVHSAIERFRTDGLLTRRSFIQIGMPHIDCDSAIEDTYGVGHKPRDIPCNREIHFYVNGGKFNMKVIQRSGDLLFGAGSINPFEFSFLQELVYNEVKKDYPELQMGSYYWDVTNAHVYLDFYDQVTAVYENAQSIVKPNTLSLTGPLGGDLLWRECFGSLVSYLSYLISCNPDNASDMIEIYAKVGHDIEEMFDLYGVPQESLLRVYSSLVLCYAASKKLKPLLLGKSYYPLTFDLSKQLDGDLLQAVVNSPFRNFYLGVSYA